MEESKKNTSNSTPDPKKNTGKVVPASKDERFLPKDDPGINHSH